VGLHRGSALGFELGDTDPVVFEGDAHAFKPLKQLQQLGTVHLRGLIAASLGASKGLFTGADVFGQLPN
jgi:hypothetical protein